ncbi:MAG: PHP domain-containing protein, partial [Candidatus Gastranaerophilaceae bacterium]
MSKNYREILSNNMGIKDVNEITSIISAEELKNYCINFTENSFKPGNRKDDLILDSHDFCYLENGEFKANLHCHTNHSDGLSDVKNILEQANKIADKNGFFLLAITDHDTINGTLEALKIISSNPDKYKNLKVILGLEISTVAINFKNQKQPVSVHLLVYGINPFDKKLEEFLERKRKLKLELANKTINELNNELSDKLGFKFSIEEAALIHEMVAKGQDEVSHPLKKYTSGNILCNFYCPDVDFTYDKP